MGTLTGYYSAVQKILSRVTSNTLNLFRDQKSDEEKIAFCLGLDYVDNAFDIQPQFEGKSLPESKRLRERGNGYYQAKSYDEALDWYTRSILVAPMPESPGDQCAEEVVLALGNRSATLYQMQHYRSCLEDIEVALKYGYPEHLQYKLYDRKGRCLVELAECGLGIKAFEKSIDVLDQSTLDEKQKDSVIENTKKQIEDCKVKDVSEILAKNAEERALDTLPPNLTKEPSDRFPSASRDFDVKYSSEKGRYGFAVNDVCVGDILMCEKPYVAVLDPSSFVNRCYHCFAVLFIPKGCHQCSAVRYCSESCRIESWTQYHHDECCFLGILQNSGTGSISHLALRIILSTGLQRIIRHKKNPNSNNSDAKSLFTDSKGVYRGGYIGLYNLLPHTGRRAKNDLLQYSILAIFVLKILEKTTFFEQTLKEMVEPKKLRVVMGGVILRFLQIISCNGIEVMEMNVGSNLSKSDMSVIGLGLFPTVSLLNHSCDPTCELIFYRNYTVVRAIKNADAGQEMSIDYGYIYYVTAKRPRQLSLESQYFFTCNCLPCQRDWGLTRQLKCDIPILKCIKCGMPLLLFSGEVKDPTKTPCPNKACGFVQNPMDYFEDLQASARNFESSVIAARNWYISEALPVLEKHLTLMDKYVCLPWKDYVTCVSTIKQCYRLQGNTNRHWGRQNFPDIK